MSITAEYREYLKSDKWKAKRRKVLNRAHYKCENCGKPGSPLQVHHLTYDRIFNEYTSDLIALCDKCHAREHGLKPKKKFNILGRVWARVIG